MNGPKFDNGKLRLDLVPEEKALAPQLADGINHAQTTETKGLVFSGEKGGKVFCNRCAPGSKLFVNGELVFDSVFYGDISMDIKDGDIITSKGMDEILTEITIVPYE